MLGRERARKAGRSCYCIIGMANVPAARWTSHLGLTCSCISWSAETSAHQLMYRWHLGKYPMQWGSPVCPMRCHDFLFNFLGTNVRKEEDEFSTEPKRWWTRTEGDNKAETRHCCFETVSSLFDWELGRWDHFQMHGVGFFSLWAILLYCLCYPFWSFSCVTNYPALCCIQRLRVLPTSQNLQCILWGYSQQNKSHPLSWSCLFCQCFLWLMRLLRVLVYAWVYVSELMDKDKG